MQVSQTSLIREERRVLKTCALVVAGLLAMTFASGIAQAQNEKPPTPAPTQAAPTPALPGQAAPKPVAEAGPQAVPGFWDPRRRPDRPDLSRISVIRFLTETDYPPFNFTGADGNPAGFNVDLARLICDEIKISCTIQARDRKSVV